MGLFNKLFDKKECAICGGEIGLMGNRKLADGNLCKNCAGKLSPFMTDRRTSTVEEIRRHLAYREENARALNGFHPNRILGTRTKVYLEEGSGRFVVSSRSSWRDANPDIVNVSQVMACDVNVHESRHEEFTKDAEGKRVSFNPPRYKYEYRFDATIKVDSPGFDEIEFELTDERPNNRYTDLYRSYESMAEDLRRSLQPSLYAGAVPAQPQAQPAAQAAGQWQCRCGAVNTGRFCVECGTPRPAPAAHCGQCGWAPEAGQAMPRFCPNGGNRLE